MTAPPSIDQKHLPVWYLHQVIDILKCFFCLKGLSHQCNNTFFCTDFKHFTWLFAIIWPFNPRETEMFYVAHYIFIIHSIMEICFLHVHTSLSSHFRVPVVVGFRKELWIQDSATRVFLFFQKESQAYVNVSGNVWWTQICCAHTGHEVNFSHCKVCLLS